MGGVDKMDHLVSLYSTIRLMVRGKKVLATLCKRPQDGHSRCLACVLWSWREPFVPCTWTSGEKCLCLFQIDRHNLNQERRLVEENLPFCQMEFGETALATNRYHTPKEDEDVCKKHATNAESVVEALGSTLTRNYSCWSISLINTELCCKTFLKGSSNLYLNVLDVHTKACNMFLFQFFTLVRSLLNCCKPLSDFRNQASFRLYVPNVLTWEQLRNLPSLPGSFFLAFSLSLPPSPIIKMQLNKEQNMQPTGRKNTYSHWNFFLQKRIKNTTSG